MNTFEQNSRIMVVIEGPPVKGNVGGLPGGLVLVNPKKEKP
jgi:hypothetical protein